MSETPRILFYVQHLLGIGHLARASHICHALTRKGAEVTMVTGGMPVAGFPGPGLNHLQLPAVQSAANDFSGLVDEGSVPLTEAFRNNRRDLLLKALSDLSPHAVVTEAFPFGRRQMRFELLPLLEQIAESEQRGEQRPQLICSIRDILQARAKPGRDRETVELIRAYYDTVMVHGDPELFRLGDSFPLAAEIEDRVIYTGLVAAPPPEAVPEGYDIVVSAGGGAVGQALVTAALIAAKDLPASLRWCVILGPNFPAAARIWVEAEREESGAKVDLFSFREDFPALLRASRVSVSQSGYNTVCDILQAGCASVLVPFASGGETEQTVRARALEARGLAIHLPEDELTPAHLAEAIGAALQRGPQQKNTPRESTVLDGAARSAEAILSRIAQPACS